jgi:hypothetical protein
MHSFRQGLLSLSPTSRAGLRRFHLARRNLGQCDTSLFRFVSHHAEKRCWGAVQDTSIQARLLADILSGILLRSPGGTGHVIHRKLFRGQKTGSGHQPRRGLMEEIRTLIGHALVLPGQAGHSLTTVMAPTLR